MMNTQRGERENRLAAAILDFFNTTSDEFRLNRFTIKPLDKRNYAFCGFLHQLLNLGVRIFVAGIKAFTVQHGDAAEFAHGYCHRDVHRTIHG